MFNHLRGVPIKEDRRHLLAKVGRRGKNLSLIWVQPVLGQIVKLLNFGKNFDESSDVLNPYVPVVNINFNANRGVKILDPSS